MCLLIRGFFVALFLSCVPGWAQEIWSGIELQTRLKDRWYFKFEAQHRGYLNPVRTNISFLEGYLGYRIVGPVEFRASYRKRLVPFETASSRYTGALLYKPKFDNNFVFNGRVMYQRNYQDNREDFKEAIRFLGEAGLKIKDIKPFFSLEGFYRLPPEFSLARIRSTMGVEVKPFSSIQFTFFYRREDYFRKTLPRHRDVKYILGVIGTYTFKYRDKDAEKKIQEIESGS